MTLRTFAAAGLLLLGVSGAAIAAGDEPTRPLPADPMVQAFAQQAGTSNQFEMTEAQIALDKSHDPKVLAFAHRMLQDHFQAEQALEHAAAPSGVVTHFMFETPLQAKIDQLQALDGAAFDQAYWADQQASHAEAVAAVGDYAASGSDPALRSWARQTLPVVMGHQRMLAAMTGMSSLAMH